MWSYVSWALLVCLATQSVFWFLEGELRRLICQCNAFARFANDVFTSLLFSNPVGISLTPLLTWHNPKTVVKYVDSIFNHYTLCGKHNPKTIGIYISSAGMLFSYSFTFSKRSWQISP